MTSTETTSKVLQEENISNEQIEQRVAELIGNGFVEKKDLASAVSWYKQAGAKAKLFEIGNLLLDYGYIGSAIEAFEAAGRIPQRVMELGVENLAAGNLHHACQLLKAAKAHDKLREVGNYALCEGVLGIAHSAFEALDDKEKLVEVAEAALLHRLPWIAYACLLLVGDKRRLAGLGSWYLEQGNLKEGLAIFEELEKEPPRGKLIACGERSMSDANYDIAVQSFELARSPEHLIKVANKLLTFSYHADGAQRVYRLAARIEAGLEPQVD